MQVLTISTKVEAVPGVPLVATVSSVMAVLTVPTVPFDFPPLTPRPLIVLVALVPDTVAHVDDATLVGAVPMNGHLPLRDDASGSGPVVVIELSVELGRGVGRGYSSQTFGCCSSSFNNRERRLVRECKLRRTE